MAEAGNHHKVLIGRQAIMDYLGVGKSTFYTLVERGLPATVIENRWYSHTENLDTYFKQVTRVRMKTIPEDAE